MNIHPLLALIAKDLRVFFTDRYSVVLSFAAPIALASFMAVIFGGNGASQPSRIAIRLVDEDEGRLSRAILESARSEPRLEIVSATRAEAMQDLHTSRAVLAVCLPAGFGEAALEAMYGDDQAPELTVVYDPTRPSDVSLGRGLLTRILLEAIAAQEETDTGPEDLLTVLADEVLGESAPADPALERAQFLELFPGLTEPDDADAARDREEFVESFPGLEAWLEPTSETEAPSSKARLPFVAVEESIVGGGPEGERAALAAHAFAGMVVQFVLFSAVEWGVALLNERNRGLWKRLRASSVSWATLMAGKVFGCATVSLLITLIVFGVGALLFRFGIQSNPLGFMMVAVPFSWAAANFGLVVAAMGKTPQGARSVAVMAVLFLVLLGGGWIPTFLFPQWLQNITPVIPTRWAIDGFDGVFSRGYGLAETLPIAGFLMSFGAVCSVGAIIGYRCGEPN